MERRALLDLGKRREMQEILALLIQGTMIETVEPDGVPGSASAEVVDQPIGHGRKPIEDNGP